MSIVLIWAAGLVASISTIQLTLAWAEHPPEGLELDKPINRVLIQALGWAVFAMVMIFAIYLNGLIFPPLAAAATALIWRYGRKAARFSRFYWLAAPLGFFGLITVLVLFQTVFGDNFFGLANIFPES